MQKRGENTKDLRRKFEKILTATAAGKKFHPNVVVIFILLLFLVVVVSVEKFH